VRDSDGLAKSSRNIYLDANQRQKALSIYKALCYIKENIATKELPQLCSEAKQLLQIDRLQYLQVTDYELNPRDSYKKDDTLVTIAGYVADTRLIDNLWL